MSGTGDDNKQERVIEGSSPQFVSRVISTGGPAVQVQVRALRCGGGDSMIAQLRCAERLPSKYCCASSCSVSQSAKGLRDQASCSSMDRWDLTKNLIASYPPCGRRTCGPRLGHSMLVGAIAVYAGIFVSGRLLHLGMIGFGRAT